MLHYLFNKLILRLQKQYNYDVQYLRDILSADTRSFIKYLAFQWMASHKANLSDAQCYAAKLRTIIREDCGPCTQLMIDMAQDAGVNAALLSDIVSLNYINLPKDIALIVQFTEASLSRQPDADVLREKIIQAHGEQGLVGLSLAISSTRVYPSLKYVLGHGKTCARIVIDQ